MIGPLLAVAAPPPYFPSMAARFLASIVPGFVAPNRTSHSERMEVVRAGADHEKKTGH
ncbi:MAG: hypothetical protein ABSC94_10750 [Polyangiaceae bacterium]|jgi:hypothetical protein